LEPLPEAAAVAQEVPGAQEISPPLETVGQAEASTMLEACPDGQEAQIFEGTFIAQSDSDLAAIANIGFITGDLIVNVEEVTHVSLDCLQRIEGMLVVQPDPPCYPLGVTETVDLPALRSVGGVTLQFNKLLHSVTLPSLGVSRGSIAAYQNPALTTFKAPELTRVLGDLSFIGSKELSSFDFPELRWAKGTVEMWYNQVVSAVSLPKLVAAGGLIFHNIEPLTSVDVGSLESVEGPLAIRKSPVLKHVALTKLEEAGGLGLKELDSCTSIAAPKLRWIGEEGLAVKTNPALTSVWLPQLEESLGRVYFSGNDSLTELFLPVLKTIGSGPAYTDSFSLADNESFHTLSLPVLKIIRGRFSVLGNHSLTGFDMPVLNTVDLDIKVEGNDELAAFSFPKLKHVRGVQVSENASLETFKMNVLYEITGRLQVSENPTLSSIDMPSLSIARGVTIDANESYTTLSLPKLKKVADFGLFVTNNPNLTGLGLYSVEKVESQLHGFVISGNDSLSWFVLPGLKSVLRFIIEENPALSGFCIPQLVTAGSEDHWQHPIIIRNNASLGDFVMPSLETIPSLIIEGNPVLSGIGMYNLKQTWSTYHRDIVIRDNPKLLALPFSGLTLVGGTLEIQGNAKLKKIPLGALTSVGGDLLIGDNESLPQCEMETLVDEIEIEGIVEVHANNDGCVCEEVDNGLQVVCE
jgi:hypothetical protein